MCEVLLQEIVKWLFHSWENNCMVYRIVIFVHSVLVKVRDSTVRVIIWTGSGCRVQFVARRIIIINWWHNNLIVSWKLRCHGSGRQKHEGNGFHHLFGLLFKLIIIIWFSFSYIWVDLSFLLLFSINSELLIYVQIS